jgi:hypothetical protein
MPPDVTTSSRPGSRRLPTIVAVGVGGLVVTVVILSLLVWIARGMVSMPVSFGSTPLGVLGLVISPICYAAIGGILAARLPANPIGWLLLAMGTALGIMLPVNLLVSSAHESLQPASSLVVWLAWVRTTFGTPIVLATVVLAVQLFPDGRPLPGRWVIGVWASIGAGLLLVVTTAIDPLGSITYPSIPNPLALPYELRHVVGWARSTGVLVIIGAAGIAVGALWHRYRRGDAVCRAQLRWIVWAAAFTVVCGVPFVIARYMLRVTDSTGELLSAIAQIGSCTFPLAAAFAISRYRLFDVDVVIGRTLVYLPMMAVLGGMYTSGIALFQRIFVAVTGSESDAAIVMTILVVATVFTPLRKGLEALVDRRFSGRQAESVTVGERQAPARQPRRSERQEATSASPPSTARAVSRVHVEVVADDGTVACPLRTGVMIQDCLRCPYLEAFGDGAELTVVCRPPAPA